MTIEARVAHLERLIGAGDQVADRRRGEAVAEASRRLIAAVNYLAAGGEPCCPVHHALAGAATPEEAVRNLAELLAARSARE